VAPYGYRRPEHCAPTSSRPTMLSVALPSPASYQPDPTLIANPDYVPAPPPIQPVPARAGTRYTTGHCPLPYELHVEGEVNTAQGGIELSFHNTTGKAGAAFQVRFGDGRTAPRTYTVAAGDSNSRSFRKHRRNVVRPFGLRTEWFPTHLRRWPRAGQRKPDRPKLFTTGMRRALRL